MPRRVPSPPTIKQASTPSIKPEGQGNSEVLIEETPLIWAIRSKATAKSSAPDLDALITIAIFLRGFKTISKG
jgi:hypothetical protein